MAYNFQHDKSSYGVVIGSIIIAIVLTYSKILANLYYLPIANYALFGAGVAVITGMQFIITHELFEVSTTKGLSKQVSLGHAIIACIGYVVIIIVCIWINSWYQVTIAKEAEIPWDLFLNIAFGAGIIEVGLILGENVFQNKIPTDYVRSSVLKPRYKRSR